MATNAWFLIEIPCDAVEELAKPEADRTSTSTPTMSVAGRPFTPVLHRLSHSRLVKRDSSRVQSRSDGRVNDLDKYERMVSSAPVEEASRSQSTWLAIGAVATTAFVFLASKSLNSDSALDRLRASATPLDVALSSGKPTVVEFYADWCEVCQELAPMTLEVRACNVIS